MKNQIYLSLIFVQTALFGQTDIQKSIPLQSGQSIVMHFDYPKIVQVSTWDKNEISIQGHVSINGGENDDAFILENSVSGNVVSVRSEIKGLKTLPERVTVVRDGKKMIFSSKAELKKYQQENGQSFNCMSFGPDIDITLDIKVPKNVITKIEAEYGIVEVKGFTGPLTVQSTYGGVDAALNEKFVGEIMAETNYGEIFTNLDTKFGGDEVRDEHFHTVVRAKPGNGPKYSFESQYGNVYIRKSVN
jgi:hypothetical protein